MMASEGNSVYIVSYARTPLGSFQGGLASFTACELGGVAIKGALERAGIAERADLVDDVLMGNVFSAGLGQAPASSAARLAGVPSSVPASTVNKVCASGMKALVMAANAIKAGCADVVVAGGMECMSRVPYLLPLGVRGAGLQIGSQSLIDALQHDGLTDAATGLGMGLCAERCATEYGITRGECDDYARQSYERAMAAQGGGLLAAEIVPLASSPSAPSSPKQTCATVVEEDECVKRYNPSRMANLKPAFKDGGTVTAANASPLSDGAAAMVLASGDAVSRHGLPVLAKIVGWADASQAGVDFTTTPSRAITKALQMAGRPISQVGYYEINEAFSVVALANIKILGLDPERVNVLGGAVALGHPLGCSGTRIAGTLTHVLRQRGGGLGVAAICNGGGGASALVIEAAP